MIVLILPLKNKVIALLTLSLILSLYPTQIGVKGGTLPLAHNLNILVVRDGLFNPLLYLSELVGMSIREINQTIVTYKTLTHMA